MKFLVVDTSVVVKWLNQDNEQDIDKADQILRDVEIGEVELLAPELLKYEVGNVLLKGKRLSAAQAKVCLGVLYSLPITYIAESQELADQAYRLAESLNNPSSN